MSDNFSQEIKAQALKLVKQCPVCSSAYNTTAANLIDLDEDGALVYFSCGRCHHSLISKIALMSFGVVGSAMLTDLEASEVLKFKNSTAVSMDDVLEIYEKLEK